MLILIIGQKYTFINRGKLKLGIAKRKTHSCPETCGPSSNQCIRLE